jgi:hypothetical protein
MHIVAADDNAGVLPFPAHKPDQAERMERRANEEKGAAAALHTR